MAALLLQMGIQMVAQAGASENSPAIFNQPKRTPGNPAGRQISTHCSPGAVLHKSHHICLCLVIAVIALGQELCRHSTKILAKLWCWFNETDARRRQVVC